MKRSKFSSAPSASFGAGTSPGPGSGTTFDSPLASDADGCCAGVEVDGAAGADLADCPLKDGYCRICGVGLILFGINGPALRFASDACFAAIGGSGDAVAFGGDSTNCIVTGEFIADDGVAGAAASGLYFINTASSTCTQSATVKAKVNENSFFISSLLRENLPLQFQIALQLVRVPHQAHASHHHALRLYQHAEQDLDQVFVLIIHEFYQAILVR